MSESGCLHNNKYESVEVENHIESNEYTVTGDFSVTNYQIVGNNLTTAVMYSCGNGEGKYNVLSHKIHSSAIEINHVAEGNSQGATRSALDAYNNYFVKVLHGGKTNGKIDFTHREDDGHDGALSYQGYVEWPPNSILYDLTIIPSRTLENHGPSGSYDTELDNQTAERNIREIVINLFSVNTSNPLIINENITYNAGGDNLGPLHMGVYPRFNYNNYLIRDFPIFAASDSAKNMRWFKHMPICVVREGGLPCEILKLNGLLHHQHGTSTTALETGYQKFEHGSKDQNPLTIPSGKGNDTSEINRSNSSPGGEPWTNFSFNNIQRREGLSNRSEKKDFIKGFKNFNAGGVKNRSSMGQFYNHSTNVGLMLNIGCNGGSIFTPVQAKSGLKLLDESKSHINISNNEVTDNNGTMSNVQFKAIFTFKRIS